MSAHSDTQIHSNKKKKPGKKKRENTCKNKLIIDNQLKQKIQDTNPRIKKKERKKCHQYINQREHKNKPSYFLKMK